VIELRIVHAAIAEARATGLPVAEVPLDAVARRAGVSRSTLFRRIGARADLEAAVAAAGVDPGTRHTVRARAVAAAADLLAEGGSGALTIEAVAERARCSPTSVHLTFGGREGLVAAVFEARSPVPRIERILAASPAPGAGARAVLEAVESSVRRERLLLPGLVAEALAQPEGAVARLFRDVAAPRLRAAVDAWLRREAEGGRCRADPPVDAALQLLLSPLTSEVVFGLEAARGRDDLVRAFERLVEPVA
jgi:AcrR family transcriptional regulator